MSYLRCLWYKVKINLEKRDINRDFMNNVRTNYLFMHSFIKNRPISKESSSANAFQNKTISKIKQMKINKEQKKILQKPFRTIQNKAVVQKAIFCFPKFFSQNCFHSEVWGCAKILPFSFSTCSSLYVKTTMFTFQQISGGTMSQMLNYITYNFRRI